jgi:hypothetical protein
MKGRVSSNALKVEAEVEVIGGMLRWRCKGIWVWGSSGNEKRNKGMFGMCI